MQRIRIDLTKIDKSAIYKGAKGQYLDITLFDNRDGTDQYGQDGFLTQDLGKERREAGDKAPICGNWRYIGQKQPVASGLPHTMKPQPAPQQPATDQLDDLPF